MGAFISFIVIGETYHQRGDRWFLDNPFDQKNIKEVFLKKEDFIYETTFREIFDATKKIEERHPECFLRYPLEIGYGFDLEDSSRRDTVIKGILISAAYDDYYETLTLKQIREGRELYFLEEERTPEILHFLEKK